MGTRGFYDMFSGARSKPQPYGHYSVEVCTQARWGTCFCSRMAGLAYRHQEHPHPVCSLPPRSRGGTWLPVLGEEVGWPRRWEGAELGSEHQHVCLTSPARTAEDTRGSQCQGWMQDRLQGHGVLDGAGVGAWLFGSPCQAS